jgi:D-aspartate ligase
MNKKLLHNNASTPPHVVIVGLDHYLGLSSARIFSAKNVPVIGIVKSKKHFCSYTNVCEKIIEADHLNENIIQTLIKLGKSLPKRAVLVPCRDVTVLIISRFRKTLAPYFHIALPQEAIVEMMMDKEKFYKFAQSEKLAIPKTFLLYNKQDALKASQQLEYPCALKPTLKTPTWESFTQLKAFKIYSQQEFIKIYDRVSSWVNTLVAQNWIKGNDENCYACNCYFNDQSEPVVTFICKSIRKWPVDTGNTSLGIECRNDILLNESLRLFKKVKFFGLCYLEMKLDDKSGQFFIIEPNIGRPTGKAAIAEAGGVELLYSMYCDLIGKPLPVNRTQQYGNIKWMYLRQDAQSAFVNWKQGRLTIKDWLNSIGGRKRFAVWSLSDPLPFWIDNWQRLWANSTTIFKKLLPNITEAVNKNNQYKKKLDLNGHANFKLVPQDQRASEISNSEKN